MKNSFTIKATLRSDKGKGASRRLRRENQVPGIVYGAGKKPQSITVVQHELLHSLAEESFYTKILNLELEGKTEQVVLKDLQRHPFKKRILHLDLLRISATEKITMRIPLHFVGGDVAPGVKTAGGLVSHLLSEIEVRCLPKDLPESVTVDLSQLELNQTVHLSDLKLAAAVEIVALAHGENKPVATVYIPRAVVEEETAPAASEVPVIGKEEEPDEAASADGDTKGKADAPKVKADAKASGGKDK